MSDESSAPGGGSLKRVQEQIERLVDHPSPLVDLGFALACERAPVDEGACKACLIALPDYVEAELNGRPVRREMREVARHIEACPRCEKVYVELLEIGLASEAEPLPVPAGMPALDLGFLPPLSLLERLKQYLKEMAEQIGPQLPTISPREIQVALATFFSQLEQLGPHATLQQQQGMAFRFSGHLPPALESVVATHAATVAIALDFSPEKLATELATDRPSAALKKKARSTARRIGMDREDANRWATLYVAHIRERSAEFLALTRELREQKPD